MRDLPVLAIHLLVTFAKRLHPGGVRAVATEFLLFKHQLAISNRSRQRAPNLTSLDRFVLGLTTLFVKVALDGKTCIEFKDGYIAGAGAAGVWTKADSVTAFDDFQFGAVAK
jgi:hypothetical protein